MKSEYRTLRLNQIQRILTPFLEMNQSPRPQRGWIRALREATGTTMLELARRLGRVPSQIAAFEKAEAEDRITLASLRAAADALDCNLVYAFVPRTLSANVRELDAVRARLKAEENVRAVAHTMALEEQAVGDIDGKIEAETQRLLHSNSRR